MALFKRKKSEADQQQVPLEIQEYYQAEKRENAAVAWLLAFGTLILTLLIAAGLFFGGRYAYRKVVHKKSNPTVTQETTKQDNSSSTSTATSSSSSSSSTDNTSTESNSSDTNSQNTTPSSTSSFNGVGTPATTNSSSQSNLPNTGPGDMVAVFVIVSIAATLAHRVYAVKRSSSTQ